jgi:hypothetical protein
MDNNNEPEVMSPTTAFYTIKMKMLTFPRQLIDRSFLRAINCAMDALKHELPIEPVEIKEGYKCPICNEPITTYQKRCINCGQSIDWEDIDNA